MKIKIKRAASRNKEGFIRSILQTWTTITKQYDRYLNSDIARRLVNYLELNERIADLNIISAISKHSINQ